MNKTHGNTANMLQETKNMTTGEGGMVLTNSKKLKYNVCTLNFNNKYIQSKKNRAKETDDTVLLFCWDTDSYRLLRPANVTHIVPLQSILRGKK